MIDYRFHETRHKSIDVSWIQGFVIQFHIVSLAHEEKHEMSPQKESEIEIAVVSHSGVLCDLPDNRNFDKNDVVNVDETPIAFIVDNGRTFGFSGEHVVKYAVAVSGSEGLTMLVWIIGGGDSRIEAPFPDFKKKDHTYPIRNLADNVDAVVYCPVAKAGWIKP